MTNTASKHGLRAAATERRNKHAQTTPLPPRKGSAGADAIEERLAEIAAKNRSIGQKGYGMMKVAELRARAKELGVPGCSRMARGDLLNAILEWEQAEAKAKASPKEAIFPEPSILDVAIEEALPIEDRAEAIAGILGSSDPDKHEAPERGAAKAASFIEFARANGWTVRKNGSEAVNYRPGVWLTEVIRGAEDEPDPQNLVEDIFIEWEDGVFKGEAYYSLGGRILKLRNASHAKKMMARSAAAAHEEHRKVSAHKVTRAPRKHAGEAAVAARKSLPFDPDTATDEQVLEFVTHGSVLSWANDISGEIESARVSRPSPTGRVQIKQGTSGRSVNFLGETGFRAVRVSSIVSIS